jgi:catechol 2,3-dioxygenase-like lactoylglutathione lyase family enzyme
MVLTAAIPVLRVFDEALARDFYLDYLGFLLEWEHRFAPDLPLYCQVARDGVRLHLTGHHGDCCPGAKVRLEIEGIDALHGELTAKRHPRSRPGIETAPWGRTLEVTDPFGNRLLFRERDAGPG